MCLQGDAQLTKPSVDFKDNDICRNSPKEVNIFNDFKSALSTSHSVQFHQTG